jgi:hypothetical protein
MTLGWFLLLSSIIGYWRVKRWEKSVRTPTLPPTAEQIERDQNIRRGLEEVFGISFQDSHEANIHNTIRIPISEGPQVTDDAQPRVQITQ